MTNPISCRKLYDSSLFPAPKVDDLIFSAPHLPPVLSSILGRQRQWTRETFAVPVVSPKTKVLKMCIFAKDGDVNNSNHVQAIHRSNDIY